MVFVKRDIPPAQQLVVWEATEVPKERLLQVTNQVNMAGMMTQFTMLMAYSHELFADLLEAANASYARVRHLGERVVALQDSLPSLESHFEGDELAVLVKMNSTPATRYVAPNPARDQHLQPKLMPKSVSAARGACKPPPHLELLDQWAEDGKPCLTKYSNPAFFLEQWAAEQDKKFAELKAERKKKRDERVARKAERQDPSAGQKPVRKLRKIRYDPQTGKRIVEEEDEPVTAAPHSARGIPAADNSSVASPASSNPAVPASYTATPANTAPLPPPNTPAATSTSGTAVPPPIPDKPKKEKKEKKEKKDKKADIPPPVGVAPTAPVDPANVPLPPPVMPTANDFPANVPAPPPPPPANIGGGPIPPPPPPANIGGGPAPPPPPPANIGGGPAPPPPPPPPAGGGGGKPADLMAAIRGGSTLKKAESGAGPMEKPVDTRSSLMENIRSGLKLKSAGERQLANKKDESSAPSSVAEILARRIAIEPDSDDDVDDDDDGEWD